MPAHSSDLRKDLQDFKGLSRWPIIAYLQKQALPPAPRRKPAPSAGIFQQLRRFAPADIWGWVSEYLRYRIGRKHPFLAYAHPERDNGIYALEGDGNEIRVALAGDWGTGTDEAFEVARCIESFDPHFSIHLGDVYFVGDPTEVKANFLGIPNPRRDYLPCYWPRGSRGSFALNGNHEMFARGCGYFRLMLPQLGIADGGRPRGQKASFFCLENRYWRIVGLDTGYRSISIPVIENLPLFYPDSALPDELVEWLRTTVFEREDKRGIVLLGHHQYCSRFDVCYRKQAEQLSEFLERPVLWFWGHEHRLAIYPMFRSGRGIAAFGRCIGHGGMPVDLPPSRAINPDCAVEFLDHRKYPNNEGLNVGYNGFARLTFRRETLAVDYVDLEGTVLFQESWSVGGDGGLQRTAAAAMITLPTTGEGAPGSGAVAAGTSTQ